MATQAEVRYPADCEAVQDFLHWWHEAGRVGWLEYPHLDYDTDRPHRAVEKKKYVCLDHGPANNWSGEFILDKFTGEVWTIEAYGRPNKRYRPRQLEDLTDEFREAALARPKPGWWAHREAVLACYREATYAVGYGVNTTFNRPLSQDHLGRLEDALEECLDKLTFFKDCLEKVGGIRLGRENVEKGDDVLTRHGWASVERANRDTVKVRHLVACLRGVTGSYRWAEIKARRRAGQIFDPYSEGSNGSEESGRGASGDAPDAGAATEC